MPNQVTRVGSWCTGHGCYPKRQAVTGSPNVFFGLYAAHRVGDLWDVHCCEKRECHNGYLVSGSSNVYVNGIALGRTGDPISCGSKVDKGHYNIYTGNT